MLDGFMRRLYQGPMDRLGRRLAARGVPADAITLAGLAAALGAGLAIGSGWTLSALVLLAASRAADGLDGSIARASRMTDFGGFLDITCDFVFYAAVPLGFAALDPSANGLPAAFLLATFYVNGASFLGYAILAAKRGMETEKRGPKSLYFTTGLAEGSETIGVFAAACLFPAAFPWLAWIFGAVCLWTAASRILLAASTFGSR